MNMADKFSALLFDDGQIFETDEGLSFDELAEKMDASKTYSAREYDVNHYEDYSFVDGTVSEYVSGDPIRYEFPDGSSIVLINGAWDIGLDDYPNRYSWRG